MNIGNEPDWYPAAERKNSILHFILWFSRFEYAMKNSSFHRTNRGYLEPDWTQLTNYLADKPIPLSLRDTVILLTSNPPNRQINHHIWRPITGDADWALLIDALKTVRNNLFHGGKHFSGQLLSPNRDSMLIDHCQLVMSELIKIAPEHIQVLFHHT